MKKNISFRPDRRSFLVNAGSLAALGILPRAIANAAIDDYRNLLLFADFEQPTLSEALAAQDPYLCTFRTQGGEVSLSTAQKRNGSKSLRSRMTNPNGTRRAEIVGSGGEAAADGKNHRLEQLKTHWYGFSTYIPDPWDSRSTCWELFHQMHGEPPQASPYYYARQPWFGIYVGDSTSSTPDHYRFVIRYCSVWWEESSRDDVKTGYTNHSISILPDVGKWVDWVVQCRPDHRPNNAGGSGLTRMWKDGQLIIDYSGPNYDNREPGGGPYVKFGLYKGDWANGRDSDPVREREYYYDEVRVSRAGVGSYDLVAPRGSSSVAPPEPPTLKAE